MRPLVASMHQLADAGGSGGDNARWQRRGEDVGAADQPHDLELGMVGNAEAAHRAHRFGEGADDEIDIVDHALLFADAAAVLADEAHRMRFIHQHHCAMLLGDGDHFLERRDIAQHRIDAFENHQLARFGRDSLEALFHRLDIVVLEGHDLGIAHRAAVPDAGMAVDVEHDIIALAGDGGDDPEIGLVAGREHHRMVHVIELTQRVLALAVTLIGPVEHTAAGGARSEIVERLLACLDHVGIEGHAHVIICAQQDRVAAVADGSRGGEHPLHDQRERILLTIGEQRLANLDGFVELGEQIALFALERLRLVGLAHTFTHCNYPACLATASTSWP